MENSELVEKVHKLEQNEAVRDEKIEVANHRIDNLEQEIKGNRELIVAVKEIASEMKHMKEDQANMNKRLQSIEEKPAKNWDKVISTIIGTITGALVGAVIALILK